MMQASPLFYLIAPICLLFVACSQTSESTQNPAAESATPIGSPSEAKPDLIEASFVDPPVSTDTAEPRALSEKKIKRFTRKDSNGDGVLSEEEFAVIVQPTIEKQKPGSDLAKETTRRFNKRDSNADGAVSLEEFYKK